MSKFELLKDMARNVATAAGDFWETEYGLECCICVSSSRVLGSGPKPWICLRNCRRCCRRTPSMGSTGNRCPVGLHKLLFTRVGRIQRAAQEQSHRFFLCLFLIFFSSPYFCSFGGSLGCFTSLCLPQRCDCRNEDRCCASEKQYGQSIAEMLQFMARDQYVAAHGAARGLEMTT